MDLLTKKIVDNAISLYSDIDMPINSCIERYLIDDIGIDCDDAFELSLDLSDLWVKENI